MNDDDLSTTGLFRSLWTDSGLALALRLDGLVTLEQTQTAARSYFRNFLVMARHGREISLLQKRGGMHQHDPRPRPTSTDTGIAPLLYSIYS
jgi:hypothetical protein